MKRKVLAMAAGVALCMLMMGVMAHAQNANVAGTWTVTQMGGRGPQMATLVLMQDGTNLTGTWTRQPGNRGGGGGGGPQGVAAQGGGQGGGGGRGPQPAAITGTIMGNNIEFMFTQQGRNGEMMFDYKGTVSGTTMKGTVSINGNDVEWTAEKQ